MSSAAFRFYPFLTAALSISLFALSSSANAQARSQYAGDASVIILPALSAEQAAPLNFGRLLPSGVAGTVIVRPEGSVVCAQGMRCDSAASPARFRVTGANGLVLVSVESSAAMRGPNNESMALHPMLSTSQFALSNGEAEISVGGSLDLPANPAEGQYFGQYIINFEYQ